MKKFAWVVLSLLLVAALVLSSCQAQTTTSPTGGTTVVGQTATTTAATQTTSAPPTAAPGAEMVKNIWGKMVEKPQYGGTIRVRRLPHQTAHFDPLWWDANNMQGVIGDSLLCAPWEKGPEGSNENTLSYSSYDQVWYRGNLAESYEMSDLNTVKYTLRKGVTFWDRPPVNGRELTADDFVWSWIRGAVNTQASGFWGPADALKFWGDYLGRVDKGEIPKATLLQWLSDLKTYYTPELQRLGYDITNPDVTKQYPAVVKLFTDRGYDVTGISLRGSMSYKVDKYTFIHRQLKPNIDVWNGCASMWALPREVQTQFGGFDDWKTVVSTGPWIPSDYVRDSSVTLVKNTKYWQKDPNLPQFQLPYADKLILLTILDDATYYAALRTAKLDVGGVVWHQVDTFKKNSPLMLYRQLIPEQSHTISVRTDIPPFNDVRVRQAAMMAIDKEAMLRDFYQGNALLYTWPIQPVFVDVYTPPEELPADIKEIYSYNPEKAKQLLKEAGYPNGFKTKFIIYPTADDRESCLVVSQYLAQVGIITENIVPEAASFISFLYGRTYEHMISCWWGNNFPTDAIEWAEGGQPQSQYNFSSVVDQKAVDFVTWYRSTMDANERNKKLKEFNLYEMRQVYNLVIPIPISTLFWWPWLKNYSGETDLGWPDETGGGEIPKYMWIDQALKAKITGGR